MKPVCGIYLLTAIDSPCPIHKAFLKICTPWGYSGCLKDDMSGTGQKMQTGHITHSSDVLLKLVKRRMGAYVDSWCNSMGHIQTAKQCVLEAVNLGSRITWSIGHLHECVLITERMSSRSEQGKLFLWVCVESGFYTLPQCEAFVCTKQWKPHIGWTDWFGYINWEYYSVNAL